MIQRLSFSSDRKTFSLSINGEQRDYANDKEGKRQAILDGLNTIETITVEEDTYLPNEAALQIVATIMCPDGVQSKEAYQIVCNVTEKACTHLGYGDETSLEPPFVPFARRGAYRQQYPPVDTQLVLDELNLAGTSATFPRQEMACTILWNKAGLAVYGHHWSKLAPAEQNLIQTQVDAIADQSGWQKDEGAAAGSYTKPLPVDGAAARSRLVPLLRQESGRPVLVSSVIYQAQLGGYGRGFYSNEMVPALQTIVTETLQAYGYRPAPEDGEYRPRPFALPAEVESDLTEKLAAITPVMTDLGQALLLQDVVAAIGVASISEWQAEQLLENGSVSQIVRQLGYKTELTWLQPYHFQPKLADGEARQVILKEVRVQNDPGKKLALAKGLPVHIPAVVVDGDNDNIVYLQMVGHKQSVRANWAALVAKKVRWIGGQRVCLDGMKEHVIVKSSLPCGWVDHILIHKQASIREMNPEEPFFLLDDGNQAIPPLFYPMLNKCLAVPVLEDWAGYLWENGRSRKLIALLNDGQGQGYAAWRTLPAPQTWQELIQDGLSGGQIVF